MSDRGITGITAPSGSNVSGTGASQSDQEKADRISKYKEQRRKQLQQQIAAKDVVSSGSGSEVTQVSLPRCFPFFFVKLLFSSIRDFLYHRTT